MDRELNDFGSGVGFGSTSGSLSGFSLCGSAIQESEACVGRPDQPEAGCPDLSRWLRNAPRLIKLYYASDSFQPPTAQRPPDGGPALASWRTGREPDLTVGAGGSERAHR